MFGSAVRFARGKIAEWVAINGQSDRSKVDGVNGGRKRSQTSEGGKTHCSYSHHRDVFSDCPRSCSEG